ncbi:MAG TPA: hypothetical protein VEK39_02230 [Solirubrobacterales bacterium]|nr:hypothetical protein [Solirubrobacterales bacterium]
MSTAAIVSLVFLALLIAWLGVVLAGTWSQLCDEVRAESARRQNW